MSAKRSKWLKWQIGAVGAAAVYLIFGAVKGSPEYMAAVEGKAAPAGQPFLQQDTDGDGIVDGWADGQTAPDAEAGDGLGGQTAPDAGTEGGTDGQTAPDSGADGYGGLNGGDGGGLADPGTGDGRLGGTDRPSMGGGFHSRTGRS